MSAMPDIKLVSNTPDLSTVTVYLKLRLGRLGNTRKIAASQFKVDEEADKNRIRASKKLLVSPELDAITKLDSKIRSHIMGICLPFDTGIHLLPNAGIPQMDLQLKKFKAEREYLVQEFVNAYPRLCEEAAKALKTLYRPSDYPPVEEVAREFIFYWEYVSFGVPEQLKAISTTIFQEARGKAQERMNEAVTEIRTLMRETLAELVNHLRERLTPEEGGKPKILKEAAVANLKTFLDTFNIRNVANDTELQALVEQSRKLLDGIDANGLRNYATARNKIREGLEAISNELKDNLGVAPVRKLRLTDDEE